MRLSFTWTSIVLKGNNSVNFISFALYENENITLLHFPRKHPLFLINGSANLQLFNPFVFVSVLMFLSVFAFNNQMYVFV